MATATAVAAPVAAAASVKKAPSNSRAEQATSIKPRDVFDREESAIVRRCAPTRNPRCSRSSTILVRRCVSVRVAESFKDWASRPGIRRLWLRRRSQNCSALFAMELARVDASFCTFFGVHSGPGHGSIYLDGSEEQKQKMAAADGALGEDRLLRPHRSPWSVRERAAG